MTSPDLRSTWAALDDTANPRALIQMMDAFNSTPWLQNHKAKVLQGLHAARSGSYLEVGCGTGADALALARQLGNNCQVVGLDSSHTMIAGATNRAAQADLPVSFRVGDIYALPFADHSFDCVYSLVTFDILKNPLAALREMHRVTKPVGTVMVSASDHGTLVIDAPDRSLTRKLLEFFCDSTYSGWVGRQLLAHFATAGLGNITVQPDTVTLRSADYPVARQILLDNIVNGAVASSVVSQAQGDQWLSSLDAAYRGQHLFRCIHFFCGYWDEITNAIQRRLSFVVQFFCTHTLCPQQHLCHRLK
jgi:ubiquinone/menaquinone biosynthesis C-methylase UbiE